MSGVMPDPPAGSLEQRTMMALEEIARWTRFMGLKGAREAVAEVLKLDIDRAIYFLSDGASVREIEEKLNRAVSRTTIGARWSEWQTFGIMKDSACFQGRKEAVFTLAELGLPVPDIVRRSTSQPPSEGPTAASANQTTLGDEQAGDSVKSSEAKQES